MLSHLNVPILIFDQSMGKWCTGRVIEVGSVGDGHEGEVKVHCNGYAARYDEWYSFQSEYISVLQSECSEHPIVPSNIVWSSAVDAVAQKFNISQKSLYGVEVDEQVSSLYGSLYGHKSTFCRNPRTDKDRELF